MGIRPAVAADRKKVRLRDVVVDAARDLRMPDTCFPIWRGRSGRRSSIALSLALAAVALGGGSGGGFRPTPQDFFKGDIHPPVGGEGANSRGFRPPPIPPP